MFSVSDLMVSVSDTVINDSLGQSTFNFKCVVNKKIGMLYKFFFFFFFLHT